MIKSITIKNFKSIGNEKIEFSNTNTIVGLNAVGKTNFLQSICFAKDIILGNTLDEARRKIALISSEIININSDEETFSINLEIKTPDNELYEFYFEIGINDDDNIKDKMSVRKEKLSLITPAKHIPIYSRISNIIKDQNNKKIPLAIAENRSVVSQYDNPNAKKFKSLVGKINVLDLDTTKLKESFSGQSEINLAGLFVQLKRFEKEKYQKFMTIIRKLLPAFSKITDVEFSNSPSKEDNDATKKSYLILMEETNLKGQISMMLSSAGDLRTLYLIAAAVNCDNGSTLIFEEIENGLHPNRLIEVLDNLINITQINNIQMIFTTHSPIVINRMRPQEVIFIKKDNSEGTKFTQLSSSEHISRIQKILGVGGLTTDYIESII